MVVVMVVMVSLSIKNSKGPAASCRLYGVVVLSWNFSFLSFLKYQ